MNGPIEKFSIDHYFSIAVFLVPALSLAVPSGYSYGALMLLVGSIVCLRKRGIPELPLLVKLIVLFMLAYALIWMTDGAIRGEGLSDLDRPSRFLFAAVSLLAIAQCRIPAKALWLGLTVGCTAAGLITVWQKFIIGQARPNAYATGIVQFGNLMIMLGLMCACGIIWAAYKRNRLAYITAIVVASSLAIFASFLSGSRGAWLALPASLALMAWPALRFQHQKSYGVALLLTTALTIGLVSAPSTGVKQRIDQAVAEVQNYSQGTDLTSSVGYRFEMWRGGWRLFLEKPLFGYGEIPYRERMQELEASGYLAPGTARSVHAHNHWVEAIAKNGLLGLFITGGLFLLPIIWFTRLARQSKGPTFALALAGIVMPVSLTMSGLSHTHFTSMNGAVLYSFMTAILVGISVSNQYENNKGK